MLGVVVVLLVYGSCAANFADKLVKIQELIREKDELLGDASYECYENGACAVEYKQGDLVTFRQEPECALDIGMEGCTVAAAERKKRDMCSTLSEEMEQQCTSKKRSASEGCSFVLQKMEEQSCSDLDTIVKRAAGTVCPDDNWHLSRGVCYRHYSTPHTFAEARRQCEKAKGGLATLERDIATDRRAFFNDVIKSSGTADKIDDVLQKLASHYNGQGWQDYTQYVDNWAWIGVRRATGGPWKWASYKKDKATDWNSLKAGQSDWYGKQPSKNGTTAVEVDHGNCVAYFQNELINDDNKGAWWNLGCTLKLPFLCEQDATS